MSIIRTPTPKYLGKGDARGAESARFDLCAWLASLVKTPTPQYRAAPPDGCDPSPPPPSDGKPDDPSCESQGVGAQQSRPPC